MKGKKKKPECKQSHLLAILMCDNVQHKLVPVQNQF